MIDTRYCPKCGRSCDPGDRFCRGCGQDLQSSAAATPATLPPIKKDGVRPTYVVGGLFAALLVVVLAGALSGLTHDETRAPLATAVVATTTPPPTPTVTTGPRTDANPAAVEYYNEAAALGDSNPTLAEQDYTLAIQADPTLGEAYGNPGLMKFHQQDWDQAETDFNKAISLIQQHGTLVEGSTKDQVLAIFTADLAAVDLGRLGNAATQNQASQVAADFAAAQGNVAAALKLDPDNSQARVLQRKLDQLKAQFGALVQ